MDYSILIGKMVIFSVLMLIGYFLARKGLVDKAFGRSASMLVINVFLPATIFHSTFAIGEVLAPHELGRLLLILTLTLCVGFALAAITARLVPIGRDENKGPMFELLLALSNTMFIALPIAQELFGAVGVFYCALACIPFNLYAYTYGVWRLKSGHSGLRIKDVFSLPLVATLLGTLVFFFRLPVPGIVRDLAASLNGATLPMSLLVIGLTMGSVSLTDAFKDPTLYLVSFLRDLLIPLITYWIIRQLTDDYVLLMTCMLMAASPSAVMGSVLAIQYGRDGVYGSQGVLQSTVFSMFTIPLLLLILG